MGKFSNAAVQTGGPSALERLASAQPPVGDKVPAAPAADPSVSFRQPEKVAAPAVAPQEELPAAPAPVEAQQQFEQVLQEEQRQAVPNLREKWKTPQSVDPIHGATASTKVDGGIFARANKMAEGVESGMLFPAVSLANTAGFIPAKEGQSSAEVAAALSAEKEGSLQASMARVNALNLTDPRSPAIDPDFIKAASLTTENTIMNLAAGSDVTGEFENDPIGEAIGEKIDAAAPMRPQRAGEPRRVAKQANNAMLGQNIAKEYQRLKGVPEPEKLPAKEAETLGDAFKMMWAGQNPDLARVVRDTKDNQKYIELTPMGEDVLALGKSDRARLFPSKNVKPAKIPLKYGELPGDTGANEVKAVQGKVGKQDYSQVHKEAMRNLAQVPNVVNRNRMKVLFSTALPILKGLNDPKTFDNWQATINNIGNDKLLGYEAKYGPDIAREEMVKAGRKLANEIQSISMERKGANYLSYAIQGFQGRISPQQSLFNPTNSKAVRFVTTNAVAAPAKPGSRVEKNLRQMYAMMLVKGADGVLPDQREIMLEGALPKLEQWGDKLAALQMSDAEAEAIATAIESGVALTDPQFPPIRGLELDPEADRELIDAISSKGEDGPHFIDGLMDVAKYAKAKKIGKTHHSYFNAYIDGKTNGIASNGIQMGITQTAQRTGVLRDSNSDYLDTEGDIRDVLKSDLLFSMDNNGFDGNVWDLASELTAVGKAIFSHRDLNKKTTMTFGYGKEVDTFGQDMYDTAMEMKANPDLIADPTVREEFLASIGEVEKKFSTPQEFGGTFMSVYGPALEGVMSTEALLTRDIMRGAAVLHAATDQLLSIKGPTGMDLNFGREAQTGETTESSYRLRGEDVGGAQSFTSIHQETKPTSAAARNYMNEDGSVNPQAGDYAYGGSVVGPVQALDASTVSQTASGKSWQRLKRASGGNPYMHTIYDAFKTDAMGYDVMLEEVNTNWLDTAMEWSYLKETKEATDRSMTAWKKEMATRDPKAGVNPGEDTYMRFITLKTEGKQGGPVMKNFLNKIGTATSSKKTGMNMFDKAKELSNELRHVGYDVNSPPDVVTNAQLRTFVGYLEKLLDTNNRLSKAIAHTDANKKRLKQEILAKGYKTPSGKTIALQYYAH